MLKMETKVLGKFDFVASSGEKINQNNIYLKCQPIDGVTKKNNTKDPLQHESQY